MHEGLMCHYSIRQVFNPDDFVAKRRKHPAILHCFASVKTLQGAALTSGMLWKA